MIYTALALLLSLGGSSWLDVPFTKQPKEGCGSASIWMVMRYWNADSTPPLQAIHEAVYSVQAGGVYARDMESYFSSHGFRTQSFAGNWNDLAENVAAGRPLIICLESNARGTPLHYVVVAGFDADDELALINDPADRKLRRIRRADLEKRWSATDFWTLLALPETRDSNPAASGAEAPGPAPDPPPDIRENLEAASSAFRLRNYAAAKHFASLAQRRRPADATTNDLLATLYFLDGNLEAALKHWNRLGKPMLHDVHVDPPVATDAVRLDRAFDFSPGSMLALSGYRRSARLLDTTGAFSTFGFDLDPVPFGAFDLTFHAVDRSGRHYLSWLRGLPFWTIQPEFADIGGTTVNIGTLLRFDPNKRRATINLDAPAGTGAGHRFRVTADGRSEQWQIGGQRFAVRSAALRAELYSVAGDRGEWSSGLALTRRNEWGTSLRYEGTAGFDFVRWPEHRLTLNGNIRTEAGRWFSGGRFAGAEPSMRLDWFPNATGSDFRTTVKVSAGSQSANVPVDERFELGLDRDSDLLLRGHPATRDGRKGEAVLARRFALLNAQIEKNVHEFGFVGFSIAPFVDIAEAGLWYADSGLEFRFSIASVFRLSVSLGRDLRTGRTAILANTAR